MGRRTMVLVAVMAVAVPGVSAGVAVAFPAPTPVAQARLAVRMAESQAVGISFADTRADCQRHGHAFRCRVRDCARWFDDQRLPATWAVAHDTVAFTRAGQARVALGDGFFTLQRCLLNGPPELLTARNEIVREP